MIKVLNLVYRLNIGGIENWLIQLLRNFDHNKFQVDFVVHSTEKGDYEAEVLKQGGRIFRCSHPSNLVKYSADLKRVLSSYGPYQVVHSHGLMWDGLAMLVAAHMGVPVRIAHSHNDLPVLLPRNLFKRLYFRNISLPLSKIFSTHGLACSRVAASSYFGKKWQQKTSHQIIFCGEDFSVFRKKVDRNRLRKELNLPEDIFVVGHVGNFREEKNHHFIVKIAEEVVKIDPTIKFLLIGDGRLRSNIEKEIDNAHLRDFFLLLGKRTDVPQLLLGVMDAFLFPSLSEGLGLALVEAQAAGLRCVCSAVIPDEADVIPSLVRRLPLSMSPVEWARCLVALKKEPYRMDTDESLTKLESSPFNVFLGLDMLEKIYLDSEKSSS